MKARIRRTVRRFEFGQGDDLVDDARQLQAGFGALDLQREHFPVEVIQLLVEDADEPDVLLPGVLQMGQPADQFLAEQAIGAAAVGLAGLVGKAPGVGPCTTGSTAARPR